MPEILAKSLLSVLLRASFIGCIIVLAILAWLPAKDLTRTTIGGHAEHFIAYLGYRNNFGTHVPQGSSPCWAVRPVNRVRSDS